MKKKKKKCDEAAVASGIFGVNTKIKIKICTVSSFFFAKNIHKHAFFRRWQGNTRLMVGVCSKINGSSFFSRLLHQRQDKYRNTLVRVLLCVYTHEYGKEWYYGTVLQICVFFFNFLKVVKFQNSLNMLNSLEPGCNFTSNQSKIYINFKFAYFFFKQIFKGRNILK